MKYPKIQQLASSLLTAVMAMCATMSLTACGGGDDNDSTSGGGSSGGGTTVSIVLRSQSIQNGAEVDATTTTVLTLEYNTTVKAVTGGDITLNGTKVQAQSNSTTTMKVDIPLSLTEGTSYTLKVGKGAIISTVDNKTSAPELTLNFTTKAKAQPVDSNIPKTPVTASTDAAKKLYTFFLNNYGQKMVSSVMADVNWNYTIATKVNALTGKYPAMNCYDFIHIYVPDGNGWINYSDIKPVTDWVNAGGIVQLMWHFNVPKSETTEVKSNGDGVTCTPSETTFKASNALKSGTWENKWFYEQMDKAAAVILQLQQAGIAATWRPFHEAAGNATHKPSWGAWFWWGNEGSDTFKQLWIAMYDYFKQKGINNLIWVWTTQNYNGDSSQYDNDADWYPGSDYCDMIARDLYGYSADKNAQEFTEIQARYPNKMVVLGECGKGDSGEQGKISDCWTKGAKWGHFMVWYQGGNGSTGTMCSDAWWKDAMSNANVITRDQVTF